jgi:hypothetical protein
MSDDQWLREALTATDETRRPAFQDELRAHLIDEWHGRAVLTPSERLRPTGRPWWTIGAAAAAVTALVVTGLVWLARRDTDTQRNSPIATAPRATAPLVAPATTQAPAPPTSALATLTTVPIDADGGVAGPVMFASPIEPDAPRMAALIVGILTMQGECLFVEDGHQMYPVLWEHGTRWDREAGAVIAPDGTTIRLLDAFEAGGGYLSRDQLAGFAPAAAVDARAAECVALGGVDEIAVVQTAPTVTSSASTEPGPCAAGLPADVAVAQFVDALIFARQSGSVSVIADCVPTIPEQFTGSAPACWEECVPRTFAGESVRHDQLVELDDSEYWSVPLPVSYDTPDGHVDVVESWQLHPADGAWQVTLASIDPPLPQRAESLAAINAYLTAVAEGDWATAADLLTQGGASPEDRLDIRQLTPQSFDRAGIAAALEAWCTAGCDTTPVDDDALEFTGGYAVTANGQTLRATWFEGHHGVYGAPFLTGGLTAAQALAGWPSPPLADPGVLEAMPYLLPGLSSEDMPGLTATRSDGINSVVGLYPRFHQIWFDPERATVLHVETVLNSAPVFTQGFHTPVEIAGWDTAFLAQIGPTIDVTLGTPTTTVSVRGIGMTEDEVVAAARLLAPRAAGEAGWQLTMVESATVAFGEGWDTDYAGHLVQWRRDDGELVGELLVGFGSIGQAMTNQHWADSRQFTAVDGAFAALTDTAGTVAITWQPEPGVTALFGWYGPVDEALAIVDSFYRLDRAEWEALVPEDMSTADGCRSLFC